MFAPSDAAPHRDTVYRPPAPVDLALSVAVLARGPGDPTMMVAHGTIWWAHRTPGGVATLALRQADGEIHARAWGSGAEHALAAVPALCGGRDDLADFDASRHPLIAELHRRMPALRLARTNQVFDALAQSVLEQKVTGLQAFRAWRQLVQRYGQPAPGPVPRAMWAAPTPAEWARIPSWAWHQASVEPPQSKALVTAAARGERLAVAVSVPGADADGILQSLPGIGAWTAAETRSRALGDPDAVSTGDYHLPHEIGYALTGERTDDAGMLALLEPWAGQRQRVIRLIRAGGPREPRRGPRTAPTDHRHR